MWSRVDVARERDTHLVVVNVVDRRAGRGPADLGDAPAVAAALREPLELALDAGVNALGLRVCAIHPRQALVETAREHAPALLVLGTDHARRPPTRGSRRRYRRAVRALEAETSCLIWTAEPSLGARAGVFWR